MFTFNSAYNVEIIFSIPSDVRRYGPDLGKNLVQFIAAFLHVLLRIVFEVSLKVPYAIPSDQTNKQRGHNINNNV